MLSFAKRTGTCLSLFALLALTGGCAGSMPDRLLQARTGAYVFHHSAPDVESKARALLEDKGFYLLAAYKGGIIRTTWRPIIDDDQFATTFERYVIVIQRLTSEHCRIEAIKMSMSTLGMETAHPHTESKNEGAGRNGTTSTYGKGKDALPLGDPAVRRDLELEWELIAKAEPERAKLVQSDIAWLVAHR
jgi:hypothetical protein